MDSRRGPIGIELVRRGILTQADIDKALEYQRRNPNKKIIEIINTLHLCDQYMLLQVLGEILKEKAIKFSYNDIKIDVKKYIALEMAKRYKAIPFGPALLFSGFMILFYGSYIVYFIKKYIFLMVNV